MARSAQLCRGPGPQPATWRGALVAILTCPQEFKAAASHPVTCRDSKPQYHTLSPAGILSRSTTPCHMQGQLKAPSPHLSLHPQAQLAAQLADAQGALMNKAMELTETAASLRQAAAEEKEGLLQKHRAERDALLQVWPWSSPHKISQQHQRAASHMPLCACTSARAALTQVGPTTSEATPCACGALSACRLVADAGFCRQQCSAQLTNLPTQQGFSSQCPPAHDASVLMPTCTLCL